MVGSSGSKIFFYSYDGSRGASFANPHAVTSIETVGNASVLYTYDNNGNLVSGDGFTYEWDYRNRLVSAGNGLGTTTFGYDHTGQRLRKTTDSITTYYPSKYYEMTIGPNGTTTTSYLFAGDTLIAAVSLFCLSRT